MKRLSLFFILLLNKISLLLAQNENEEEIEIIYRTEPYEIVRKKIECIEVIQTDADLTFEQSQANDKELCGTFFAGSINDVISVEIIDTNLNCDNGETLKFFDGWATLGGMIPNEQDHELAISEREVDYCRWIRNGRKKTLIFQSTQNVAQAQYRTHKNTFISFRFRKVYSEKPKCHVVTPFVEGEYTMTSVRGRNCTFSIIQPSQLLIKEVKFGISQGEKNTRPDTIEILNGESLDIKLLDIIHTFSSPFNSKDKHALVLKKGHVAVRMTSSGVKNVITFSYSKYSSESESCYV